MHNVPSRTRFSRWRFIPALTVAVVLIVVAACQQGGGAPTRTTRPPQSVPEEPAPTETPAATATPEPALTVGLAMVAEGLTSPVALIPHPDANGQLFIVDQAGLVRVVDEEETLVEEPFLDVRDRMVELMPEFDERGLLGLAFHPQYADNGRFFVYYSAPLRESAPEGWNHTATISEFVVSDDPMRADPDSERVLLEVDQPQFNHNGGTVAFGPDDGYLYISLGDGGNANDVGLGHNEDIGNGQDRTELLGSVLRIDVDEGDPYGIPEDNPLVTEDGADEIYAYGFRNPYRMSFDSGGDHELFVGDAGQELYEEVSIVESGGNYGWNIFEGTHCFDPENPEVSPDECPTTGPWDEELLPPVIEYRNAKNSPGIGLVVVGGYVYRGSAIPELEGRYVFGDWSASFEQPAGTLLMATRPESGDELWTVERIGAETQDGETLPYLLGFGHDADGELYVLTTEMGGPTGDTGRVHRLVPVNE